MIGRKLSVHRLLIVLVAIGLLASACSGDDDPPATVDTGTSLATATTNSSTTEPSGASSSDSDVCALLSSADLQEATGHQFGEGVFNEGLSVGGIEVCDWKASDAGFVTVTVAVVRGNSAYEDDRDSQLDLLDLPDFFIAGTDDAYAAADGSLVGMRTGDLYARVTYIPDDYAGVLDATQQLAEAIAQRL